MVMGEHKQGVLNQFVSNVGIQAAVLSSSMSHKHQRPNTHKHSIFSNRQHLSYNTDITLL